jgi:phage terminase small subunit
MKNKKWKIFADEYLLDMNASRAYVAAGYSGKTPDKNAYKLLQKEVIKDYIQEQQDKMAVNAKIDREFLIQEYKELLKSCKAEGLYGDGTVKDRGNWNRALAQMAKMLGIDAPQEITGEITHVWNVGFDLPDSTEEE